MAQPLSLPVALADAPRVAAVRHIGPNTSALPQSQTLPLPIKALLASIAGFRQAPSVQVLQLLLVNDAARLCRVPQAMLLEQNGSKRTTITAVSSVSAVDANAPLIRWLEQQLAIAQAFCGGNDRRPDKAVRRTLLAEQAPGGAYPFAEVLLLPIMDRKGRVFALLALLGNQPVQPAGEWIAGQLADAAGHAFSALQASRWPVGKLASRRAILLTALAAIVLGFVPVPMTVLAPAEVVAFEPAMVAAPMQGVIATLHVEPNQKVAKGDLLFSYEPVELAARHEIALRKADTAASKLRTIEQEALRAQSGARDLAEARAEHALAQAELDRAGALLGLARVHAPADGVAIFSNRQEWTGKPVQTGERIIEIAQPAQTRFRIDMAVSDAIVLENGTSARVFLDANPLSPVSVEITSRSYRATRSAEGRMVHQLTAQDTGRQAAVSRIGLRGTAQVFGDRVCLGFFLFRKPLSAFRQYFGV